MYTLPDLQVRTEFMCENDFNFFVPSLPRYPVSCAVFYNKVMYARGQDKLLVDSRAECRSHKFFPAGLKNGFLSYSVLNIAWKSDDYKT